MFLEVPLGSASKTISRFNDISSLAKGASHLSKRISVPSHTRNEIEKRTYAQTLPDNTCIFMGSMKTTVPPFAPHGVGKSFELFGACYAQDKGVDSRSPSDKKDGSTELRGT
jgi:hypothetical protein